MPIRRGRISDLSALVAIENRSFASDRLSRRSLRYFLSAHNAVVLIAESDGVIAGYALVAFRKGSGIARLYSIAIDPAFRGRNLGCTLLKEAEKTARAGEAQCMRLEVRSRNKRAIALYESQGYQRFGRIADYYEDGAAAFRYEKPIQRLRA
ncbi:MAG: GNAT family N-acetyltransferase [Methylovirgula sp.]